MPFSSFEEAPNGFMVTPLIKGTDPDWKFIPSLKVALSIPTDEDHWELIL